jgi:hypothetical protein
MMENVTYLQLEEGKIKMSEQDTAPPSNSSTVRDKIN